MTIPADYLERTYAGILGKIIGVYLGRPFEQWTHERIARELGTVWHYVHDKLGKQLLVTDDDISGTFTFIRALDDYAWDGADTDVLCERVGRTWLNYIIDRVSILWWGGVGRSTEHTAYARLAAGIAAPASGSIATNGIIVAEQIGAQIFIDGWGMVSPGDPERAAALAAAAGRVSHDGTAVHAAQVVAALVSLAYVSSDMDAMLDSALDLIPRDSIIRKIADELREIRAAGKPWNDGYAHLAAHYGYDKFPGTCHVVPNHSLIWLALLFAPDSVQRALSIVNTAGWDTDCNSGNVGAIMGVFHGLAGLDATTDLRGPVGDQFYLPTADGGGCVTDAVQETYRMARRAARLAGQPAGQPAVTPPHARYHFSLPGSTQGFRVLEGPDWTGRAALQNVATPRGRALSLSFAGFGAGQGVATLVETFPREELYAGSGYSVTACPTAHPGQLVTAEVALRFAPAGPASAGSDATATVAIIAEIAPAPDDPSVARDGSADGFAGGSSGAGARRLIRSAPHAIVSGATEHLEWRLPDTEGAHYLRVGVEMRAAAEARECALPLGEGVLTLHSLHVSGPPSVTLKGTGGPIPPQWRRQWIAALDRVEAHGRSCHLLHDAADGLFYTGTREWRDYRVLATLRPHLAVACGVVLRVQGVRRYVAVQVYGNRTLEIVERWDEERNVAVAPIEFAWEEPLEFDVSIVGQQIRATVGGVGLGATLRNAELMLGGAAGVLVSTGSVELVELVVRPADVQDTKGGT